MLYLLCFCSGAVYYHIQYDNKHYSKQIIHCFLTTQVKEKWLGVLWKVDRHSSELFGGHSR